MKIIYSFDTICGTFKATDFFIKMCELSVFSARRTGAYVVLYTDDYGANFFRNKTRCRFHEIIVVDWFKHKHNPAYWNFCKLQTYAMQKEAFLHIDFDVYLMQGFEYSEPKGIITEQLRPYTLTKEFIEVKLFDTITIPSKLICSGLLGGSVDTTIWGDLFDHAKQVCKNHIDTTHQLGYLVGVEEFCLTQLAEFHGVKVTELPKNFVHWQGPNKQERFGEMIKELYETEFLPTI